MAARLTVLALAASAGPFLDDEDTDRARRACRDWRRAAESVPHIFLSRAYARVLRDPIETDEQRLATLHAVSEMCHAITPNQTATLCKHTLEGFHDVVDAVVAAARPIIADVTQLDPIATAALDTLAAVVGCGIPVRDRLADQCLHLDLYAALKQEEGHNEATALEQQGRILRVLVPLCPKPVPKCFLGISLSTVPWVRLLDPAYPRVVDAMGLLVALSDGPIDVIQAVLNAGVVPLIVKCAKAGAAVFCGLRVLGNICAGSDVQTQVVINAGGVDVLASQLTSDVPSSRKEASWALSNIAAGTVDQIDALIKHPTVVRDVLANFTCAWPDVQKESVWTVANMTSGGTQEQLRILVEAHASVEALCAIAVTTKAVTTRELRMVVAALEGIGNCLRTYEYLKSAQGLTVNALVARLRATTAFDQLASLAGHPNQDVRQEAAALLDEHFDQVTP